MVEQTVSADPPKEARPLEYSNFNCSTAINQDQLFENLTVYVTFTFGRRDPISFGGNTYLIKNGDQPQLEAKSFFEAANKAWERYKNSQDEFEFMKIFTQKKLEEKWTDLDGEKLTGLKLPFKATP